MQLLVKAAGLWLKAKRLFVKKSNAWVEGRFAYLKQNGVWKLAFSRPYYALFSYGLLQSVSPPEWFGVWLNHNRAVTGAVGRSYTLVQFNANGIVTSSVTFDLHADGIAQNQLNEATRLKGYLDAMQAGQLFAIVTYDEPSMGRMLGGLPEAMYRVGVTQAYYENFKYRGAYLILGRVGRAPYYENYIGEATGTADSEGDPNAAINLHFYIEEGNPIIFDSTPIRPPPAPTTPPPTGGGGSGGGSSGGGDDPVNQQQ